MAWEERDAYFTMFARMKKSNRLKRSSRYPASVSTLISLSATVLSVFFRFNLPGFDRNNVAGDKITYLLPFAWDTKDQRQDRLEIKLKFVYQHLLEPSVQKEQSVYPPILLSRDPEH